MIKTVFFVVCVADWRKIIIFVIKRRTKQVLLLSIENPAEVTKLLKVEKA